ncbi:hydroxyproline-rich glycoprotein family protein [Tanacetum coccineum]
MTDSSSLNKTHFQDPKPPKSKLVFLFSKSLIIIFVLVVFTYFPSQVPEYFNKTSSSIVTKLWDLIYLLVIGIAVCYGLFSTRKLDNLDTGDDSVKETYLSGISDISSIFDNGVQNSYGFEEMYFVGHLDKPKTAKRSTPLGLPVRNLVSKSLDSGGGNLVISSDWDEVKKGKFRGLVPIKLEDKFKESDLDCDSRPVLNWRSKSMRLEKREDMCTTEVNGSSHVRGCSVEVGDFEGLKSQSMRFSVMKNSSEKQEPKGVEANHGYMQQQPSFMESKPRKFGLGGSSEMNNRLSSKDVLNDFGKIKVEDGTLDGSSHVRGCSVEFGDFEGLKSQSMRFSVPPQMKNSSEKQEPKVEANHGYMQQPSFMESKPRKFGIGGSSEMNNCLSSNDVLNDFGKIKVEDGTLDGSSKEYLKDCVKTEVIDSALDSNNNVPFVKPKSQRSSTRASSEMNNHSNSNGILKDFGKNNVNGTLNGSSKEYLKAVGKAKVDDGIKLDSNKDAPIIKSKSRRSSLGAPSEMNLETFDYVLGKEDKADPVDVIPKPAPNANTYKRGKSVRTNRQKEQVLETKVKIFPSPSNDKVETRMEVGANATDVNLDQNLSDTEPYSSEVDRKADEFIAKFREQIRLQRVASARKLNHR